MNELIDRVNNLISSIDNSKQVQDIKKINKELLQNQELSNLLQEYKYNKQDKLKKKIIDNNLFQKYKEKETEINILIMHINQKLKKINVERSCNK